MRPSSKTKGPERSANSVTLPVIMVVAGLARIAMTTSADMHPDQTPDAGFQDPVAVRRNVQLVTAGLHGLLCRFGLAMPAAAAERCCGISRTAESDLPG